MVENAKGGTMAQDWISQFPGLARLGPDLRATLLKQSLILTVPAGTVVFGPGKPPEHLLLLLGRPGQGPADVGRGPRDRLYRVAAGESCVMTTACLLAHEDYSAEGIAETDVRAAAIPRALFERSGVAVGRIPDLSSSPPMRGACPTCSW